MAASAESAGHCLASLASERCRVTLRYVYLYDYNSNLAAPVS